jgi:hypothetical protein
MPDTSRLLLNSPLGSDPFLRQDFTENWDILDKNPGIFVCTSTSPPAWGGAQAGRKIFETDTRRIRNWTGTGWQNIENYPRGTSFALTPTEGLGKNVKKTYTLSAAYNVPRACRLMLIGSARFTQEATAAQSVMCVPWIDDASVDVATSANTLGFGDAGSGASSAFSLFIPLLGEKVVTAGNHKIQVRVEVGNVFNNSMYVYAFRMIIVHTE